MLVFKFFALVGQVFFAVAKVTKSNADCYAKCINFAP